MTLTPSQLDSIERHAKWLQDIHGGIVPTGITLNSDELLHLVAVYRAALALVEIGEAGKGEFEAMNRLIDALRGEL